MYDKQTITHLVLSGGGGAGFIYLGALRYLQQESYNYIKHISATSIGSLFGTIFALNISMGDLELYLKENLNNFGSITINFLDLINDYGLIDPNNDNFFKLVKEFFKKYNYHTYTFLDIAKNKGINIHIQCTHFHTLREFTFNVDNTPNVLLLDAIFASMSIPLVYKPYKIGNELYIDGGLINNIPVTQFLNVNPENIFIIQTSKGADVILKCENNNIISYILNMLNCINHERTYKTLIKNNYKYYLTFKNNPITTIPYSIDDNFILTTTITSELIDTTIIEGYEQIYKFIKSKFVNVVD